MTSTLDILETNTDQKWNRFYQGCTNAMPKRIPIKNLKVLQKYNKNVVQHRTLYILFDAYEGQYDYAENYGYNASQGYSAHNQTPNTAQMPSSPQPSHQSELSERLIKESGNLIAYFYFMFLLIPLFPISN